MLESLDILEADGKQFCTFKLTERPGGPLIAITVPAMVQSQTLRDALSDVNLAFEAIDTGIGSVSLRHDSTDAAADHSCL